MDHLTEQTVARYLLQVEAVRLSPKEPFTWASGWKSPIYCDNRRTLSYPEARNYIKMAMAKAIIDRYPETQVIAGVATGAISWGAFVADALNLPFVYVRSQAKDHGMKNLIEGYLPENSRVLVVEDLISTGGSSLKAVEALRDAGADILGLYAVYTHGFEVAEQLFAEAGVAMHTLSNYNAVIEEALRTGYIAPEVKEVLQEWRKDPANWGK
ncbi:orotate phosphoribosyltransferase [Porphyromonas gingivicanis]|uniref:Orotate phosphoribosyltransferase n=1 Tax=Porphyromonas gingivicanis TaxID=266762 RepID=A0A0A2G6X8_9PORP|nr:orotate phosphoribosyltransferase [Porphyromonas gingivicanis]KGN99028.1 orotate phosphoribosyltransferase [Porphyromonas gingivicanis]